VLGIWNFTRILQRCYKGVTRVLQKFYKGVTREEDMAPALMPARISWGLRKVWVFFGMICGGDGYSALR
jgi:hypothetical protein